MAKQIAAVIGFVSAVIGIIVFLTGRQSINQFFLADSATPTIPLSMVVASPSTPPLAIPTLTTMPSATAHPTDTTLPTATLTNTPLPPTATITPVPSPTSYPDTPNDAILQLGEDWVHQGLELSLTSAKIDVTYDAFPDYVPNSTGIEIKFRLTSHKNQNIALKYNVEDIISAIDNQGRELRIGWRYPSTGEPISYDPPQTQSIILEPDQTVNLIAGSSFGGRSKLWVKVDTTSTSITEVIVTVSDLSEITNARWRIPINH